MSKENLLWIGAGLAATMFGVLVAFGASGVAIVFFVILGALLMTTIGWSMRTVADRKWLPTWVIIGFAVKLGGTLARFYMVTVLYGLGDSFRYHRVGTKLATQWRQGRIPELDDNIWLVCPGAICRAGQIRATLSWSREGGTHCWK